MGLDPGVLKNKHSTHTGAADKPWVLGVTLGRCSLDVAMTIVTVIAVNHDAYAVGLLLQLLGHTSQRLELKLNLTSG